ncbi:hypothetical protein [Streptomyces sp. H27-H5]|uniref:hypothetical protein n=1 Tax=Streptomyces sp. H27-H5 TaxID=2996460 RepID=UPI0022720A9B|nr:hypothetical protein [Streptomyces sp. H27-H5]MCY0959951.1 hypothetical protein [Streptomyces sp. H27-H5]
MTECIAATCSRELRDHEITALQLVCDPCLHAMRAWLTSIPGQMVVLREGSMQREVSGGGRTGTRTAPLPGRLDTLNLCGPAATGTVIDRHGDQTGDIPIVGTLGSWVRLIIEERPAKPPTTATETTLAAWLVLHLGWASQQPWVAEMRSELHDMMSAIWRITSLEPRTRAVSRPCPRCQYLGLIERDWAQYTECTGCGGLWTKDELNADALRRAAA